VREVGYVKNDRGVCTTSALGLYRGWNLSGHDLSSLFDRSNRAGIKRKWLVISKIFIRQSSSY
jgi:hypothetical protein